MTINPINDAPVAADDSAATALNTAVTISVLSNDTDIEGDTLSISGTTAPAHGSVVNNITSLTYTPQSGYSGIDSFAYTVSDGNGGTNSAVVTVTISEEMYVAGIDMSLVAVGRNYKGNATVLIEDFVGQGLAAATVVGDWYFNGALLAEGVSAETDSQGYAVLLSNPKPQDEGGTFTFVVTDVVLTGYTYNSALSAETQDSISF